MKVVKQISALRAIVQEARSKGQTVGLVPTMGYLHEGHFSLMEAARAECDLVVVSIFVNPLQFGPNEDYETYPRDADRDIQAAEERGVDVVFMPEVAEMYPQEPKLTVTVSCSISEVLCGASRPGHFDGVATVVLKLLNIVQPSHVFFGLKDAQQVAVIERLIEDFNLPVQLIGCPTVREPDGLAKSSRNVYLNDEERKQAVVLSEALALGRKRLEQKNGTIGELLKEMEQKINTAPLAKIDYVEACTYPNLERLPGNKLLKDIDVQILLAVAVKFGNTRLIDNSL